AVGLWPDVNKRQRGKEPGLRPARVPLLRLVHLLDDLGIELRPTLPAVALAGPNVVANVGFHYTLATARCAFRASSRALCESVCRLVIRGLMKFWVMLAPPPDPSR